MFITAFKIQIAAFKIQIDTRFSRVTLFLYFSDRFVSAVTNITLHVPKTRITKNKYDAMFKR